MEVKIGVQYAHRELVLESTQSPPRSRQAVNDALSGKAATLSLVDDKGRRVIVADRQAGLRGDRRGHATDGRFHRRRLITL